MPACESTRRESFLLEPGHYQLAEDLVSSLERIKAHRPPSRFQGFQEHPHPTGGDRYHRTVPAGL